MRLFETFFIIESTDFIAFFRFISVFVTVFKIGYRYADGYSPWDIQMTKHPGNERFRQRQKISENLSFQF